jgi:hypothetical protein
MSSLEIRRLLTLLEDANNGNMTEGQIIKATLPDKLHNAEYSIYKNPSHGQLMSLLRRSTYKSIRGILTKNDNLYIFDEIAYHTDVYRHLDDKSKGIDHLFFHLDFKGPQQNTFQKEYGRITVSGFGASEESKTVQRALGISAGHPRI